jgi:hypothetical protein
VVEGARPEHRDDGAGKDGRGNLGPRSRGDETEQDAKRDGDVEGPLVGDAAETWLQLADSRGSHESTRSRWPWAVPEEVAGDDC